MKSKTEILYTNLIEFLDKIIYNAESYYISNELFEKSIASFENLSKELSEHLSSNNVYTFSNEIIEDIVSFDSDYSNFPDWNKNKIIAIYNIIKCINENIVSILTSQYYDLTKQIDESKFILHTISDKDQIKIYNSEYGNSFYIDDFSNLENSILFIDFENITDSLKIFDDSNFEILFYLLEKLSSIQNFNNEQFILVKNENFDSNELLAFVKLKLLAKGKQIHLPLVDNRIPESVNFSNQYTKYQQFNEIIHILSEYNAASNNILDKYLKMYHVIENFMYRYPICKLEKENDGDMFSIRDFQRLYSDMNKNETNTLKNFIQKVLQHNYDTTAKFNDIIWGKWKNTTSLRSDEIEKKVLAIFELNKDNYSQINLSTLENFYPLLIYAFRNAIVHNKATEFHFTHTNIVGTIYFDLIKEFLLPSLEIIVFHLITRKSESNSLIWFSNSELKLWQ